MTLDFESCTDGELAALAAGDHRRAFATLMQRHEGAIYRLVRAHVGDTGEAMDVSQETFVAAYLAIRRYDPARPLRAWLARIALNKCRDWGRRRAVRKFFSFAAPLTDAVLVVADDTPSADDVAADRQALAGVAKALATLPQPLKEPLILCAIEGLSQAEAAGVLGISEKAIETRIRRARAKLVEIVGPR